MSPLSGSSRFAGGQLPIIMDSFATFARLEDELNVFELFRFNSLAQEMN